MSPKQCKHDQKKEVVAACNVEFLPSFSLGKVEPPKTNSNRKTNTMYHMHTLGASKCMHQ